MTRLMPLILIACLLGCAFSQAQSQSQSPSSCPTFYSDYNQQGTSFQLCSSGDVAGNQNDAISSFTVPVGYSVRLHGDAGFSGEYWGPYTPGVYNVPASFNDKVSSVSIFAQYNANPRCPTFYGDFGLGGSSFQLCSSGNVPKGWSNAISSFVVPAGFSVQLYTGANQQGQTRGPYSSGPWNVPVAFNDLTNSIAITNYASDDDSSSDSSDDLSNLKCPVFYLNANQKGASFQLCSTGNVPTQYNDQVSSFAVPAGFSVQLFPNYNQGGDYWGPYTEGKYNVADGFNDELSSVAITVSNNNNGKGNSNSNNNNNWNNGNNGSNNGKGGSNNNGNSGSSNNNNNWQKNISCPAFFTSANQRGSNFQLCSSANVPSQFNDKALSIYVPQGYQLRLYQNYNYSGTALGPYNPGTYNLPNNFGLSSAVITPLVPTFYFDYNLQGADFQLSASGNLASNYNDQASSFTVPAGYSVTLYGDYGYQGASYGPYDAGSYNVATKFNDQLSSVKITQQKK